MNLHAETYNGGFSMSTRIVHISNLNKRIKYSVVACVVQVVFSINCCLSQLERSYSQENFLVDNSGLYVSGIRWVDSSFRSTTKNGLNTRLTFLFRNLAKTEERNGK